MSSSEERFRMRVACYLLLLKDGNVLLLRRYNTGWADGMYSFVSGHLDGGETLAQAMVREANEEAGITIREEDLKVVHAMHRNSNFDTNSQLEMIDFFLTTEKWKGEPKVMEEDKSDEIAWYPVDNLPKNTLPHIQKVLDHHKKNIHFSTEGF